MNPFPPIFHGSPNSLPLPDIQLSSGARYATPRQHLLAQPAAGETKVTSLTALFLSRLQFAFTVSFHIIFPSFSIGLAAWLAVLEGLNLVTKKPVYRRLFEFWLKIFGVAFGLGVVSGIVLAFEMGLNWSRLSQISGPIQGPLLVYESFTAFALEAAFFGVLIYGRRRVSSACLIASDFIRGSAKSLGNQT
jgi:cytochrome bd-type quinol oxidase subunit 1